MVAQLMMGRGADSPDKVCNNVVELFDVDAKLDRQSLHANRQKKKNGGCHFGSYVFARYLRNLQNL